MKIFEKKSTESEGNQNRTVGKKNLKTFSLTDVHEELLTVRIGFLRCGKCKYFSGGGSRLCSLFMISMASFQSFENCLPVCANAIVCAFIC